jgi:lipoprotein-anchoring transpeptidase ErfK/SrfK
MRRVLLAILVLAFGMTSAEARHRHYQSSRYVYAFPGDMPPMAAPRTFSRRLQRERSHRVRAARPSEPARSAPVDSRRAPEAGQGPGRSATTPSLDVPRGPVHVVVSIRDQRLTLYRNGVPVAHSKVSTGTSEHPTPTGIFSVIQKKIWHESNLYSRAPMPYMQRITWSGVALHAGVVPGYPASHGCIRLPAEFAKLLWSATRMGTRVIVASTAVVPVEIAHPRLAALARKPVERLAMGDSAARPAATDVPASATVATTAEAIANASATDIAPRPLAAEPPRTGELVSVLVSRKEARLFVRAGFQPLFDVPVTIRQPDQELGTHLFTAMEAGPEGVSRWVAVSMPRVASETAGDRKSGGDNPFRHPQTAQPVTTPAPAAPAALDRIEIPQDAMARISELLSPGASLIISDQGISSETGRGTDFIVLMPGPKPQATGTKRQIARKRTIPTHSFAPRSYRSTFRW